MMLSRSLINSGPVTASDVTQAGAVAIFEADGSTRLLSSSVIIDSAGNITTPGVITGSGVVIGSIAMDDNEPIYLGDDNDVTLVFDSSTFIMEIPQTDIIFASLSNSMRWIYNTEVAKITAAGAFTSNSVASSTGLFGGGTLVADVALQVEGGALLPPRLDSTARDALTPTNGMLIYNTTLGSLQYYSSAWTSLDVGADGAAGAVQLSDGSSGFTSGSLSHVGNATNITSALGTYNINSVEVLSADTLGNTVLSSSLTSLGIITDLQCDDFSAGVAAPGGTILAIDEAARSATIGQGSGNYTISLTNSSLNIAAASQLDFDLALGTAKLGSLTGNATDLLLASNKAVIVSIDDNNAGTADSVFTIVNGAAATLFGLTLAGLATIPAIGSIGGTTLANASLLIGSSLGLDSTSVAAASSLDLVSVDSSSVRFMMATSEIARATSSGIGIGVTGPQSGLHVRTAVSATPTWGAHLGANGGSVELKLVAESDADTATIYFGHVPGDYHIASIYYDNTDLVMSFANSGSDIMQLSDKVLLGAFAPITNTGGDATDLITMAALANSNYFVRYRNAASSPGYAGVMFSDATASHWSIYNSSAELMFALSTTSGDTPAYDDGTIAATLAAGGFDLLDTNAQYEIASTSVLSATTLGSGVVNSSLTSVGTLTGLTVGSPQMLLVDASGVRVGSGAVAHRFSVYDSATFSVDVDTSNIVRIGSLTEAAGVLHLESLGSVRINIDSDASGADSTFSVVTDGATTLLEVAESGQLTIVSTAGDIGGSTLANSHLLIGNSTTGLGLDINEILASGSLSLGTLGTVVETHIGGTTTQYVTATGLGVFVAPENPLHAAGSFVTPTVAGVHAGAATVAIVATTGGSSRIWLGDDADPDAFPMVWNGTIFDMASSLVIESGTVKYDAFAPITSTGSGATDLIQMTAAASSNYFVRYRNAATPGYAGIMFSDTTASHWSVYNSSASLLFSLSTTVGDSPAYDDGSTAMTLAATSLNLNNSGAAYQIGGTAVLSDTTLGTGVVNSSLTSVGILTSLDITGNLTVGTDVLYVDTAAGKVGVNATPSYDLDIHDIGGNIGFALDLSSGTVARFGTLAAVAGKSLTMSSVDDILIEVDNRDLAGGGNVTFVSGDPGGTPVIMMTLTSSQTLNVPKTTTTLLTDVISSTNYDFLAGTTSTGLAIDAANIRSTGSLGIVGGSAIVLKVGSTTVWSASASQITVPVDMSINDVLFVDAVAGEVGINTASPSYELDIRSVLDDISFSVDLGDNTNAVVGLRGTNTQTMTLISYGNVDILCDGNGAGSDERSIYFSTGSLGASSVIASMSGANSNMNIAKISTTLSSAAPDGTNGALHIGSGGTQMALDAANIRVLGNAMNIIGSSTITLTSSATALALGTTAALTGGDFIVNSDSLFVDISEGRVGVNCTPSYALDVQRVGGGVNCAVDFPDASNAVLGIRGATDYTMSVVSSGDLYLISDASGTGTSSDIYFATDSYGASTNIAKMTSNITFEVIKTTTSLASSAISTSNFGVLIGTTSTGLALDAANVRCTGAMKIISASTIELESNSNSAIFISSAKVGFGTSSPESAVTISGAIDTTPSVAGVHLGMNSTNAVVSVYGAASGDAELRLWGIDDANYGGLLYDVSGSNLLFNVGGSAVAQFAGATLEYDGFASLTTSVSPGDPSRNRGYITCATSNTGTWIRFRQTGTGPRENGGIIISDIDRYHWFTYAFQKSGGNDFRIAYSSTSSSTPEVETATSLLNLTTSGELNVTSYSIGGTSVLTSNTLGSGIVNSSLQNLGAQNEALDMNSNDISSVRDISCRSIDIGAASTGAPAEGVALDIADYTYTVTSSGTIWSGVFVGQPTITGAFSITVAANLLVGGPPLLTGGATSSIVRSFYVVDGISEFGGDLYVSGDTALSGINISAGASVDMNSVTGGFRLARLSGATRTGISGTGMMCYDTTAGTFYGYDGSWKTFLMSDISGSSGDVLLSNGSGDITVGNLNFASNVLDITNSGGQYHINGTLVLSSTTLGTGILYSSLSSLGVQVESLDMGTYDINNATIVNTKYLRAIDTGVSASVQYTRIYSGNGDAILTSSNDAGVVLIEGDTVTAGSAITVPNLASLYISGVPIASTNVTATNIYAIYVAAGNTYLSGDLNVGGKFFVDDSASQATVVGELLVSDSIGGGALSMDIVVSGPDTTAVIKTTGSGYDMSLGCDGSMSFGIDSSGSASLSEFSFQQSNASYDQVIFTINQQGRVQVKNTASLSTTSISGAKFVIGNESTGMGFSHNQIYTSQSSMEIGTTGVGSFTIYNNNIRTLWSNGTGMVTVGEPVTANNGYTNVDFVVGAKNGQTASLYIIEGSSSGITAGAGGYIEYNGGPNTIIYGAYISGTKYPSFKITRSTTPGLTVYENVAMQKSLDIDLNFHVIGESLMEDGVTIGSSIQYSDGESLCIRHPTNGVTGSNRTSAPQTAIEIMGSSVSNRFQIGYAAGSVNALQIYYNDTAIAYFDSTTPIGAITFTGQHRCQVHDEQITARCYGLIVIAMDDILNLDGSTRPTINESLPLVCKARQDRDPRVFGVISAFEDNVDGSRVHDGGVVKSVVKTMSKNDKRLFVNSIGEGAVWVTNRNGAIANGDYIESSAVAGYGQRSDSDQLRNYTVAKATTSCDFSLEQVPRRVPKLIATQVTKKRPVYDTIQEYYMHKDIRYYNGKYHQVSTRKFRTIEVEKYDIHDLYDIDGNVIGQHKVYIQEDYTVTTYETVYDSNGYIVFEDELDAEGNPILDYKFDTRFVGPDGYPITREEYDRALAAGEEVYIAQFIGCTYHCG